jgi:hypothetical protein
MKEYNPSDSQEPSTYEINRRGVLGLLMTSAGMVALAACGGEKKTTPEQTSGQLPEHVESSDNTPSPEVSPTPEVSFQSLESSEFNSEVELFQRYFESNIPDKDKFKASLCIPERIFSDPAEMLKAFGTVFETVTNVFTYREDEENKGVIPVSEVEKVWKANEFGRSTTKKPRLIMAEELVDFFLEEYCVDTILKKPGVYPDGNPEPLNSTDLRKWLINIVNAQLSLQREPEGRGSAYSVVSPANPDRILRDIKVEGLKAEKQSYAGSSLFMKNVTLRPDTNYNELSPVLKEENGISKGDLDQVLGESSNGLKFEKVSFTKSETNPGTAVLSELTFYVPRSDTYTELHQD